jgi:hypothetical protein
MGTTVTFNPPSIHCGVIPPGAMITKSARCAVISAPASVTASISGDTSDGALAVLTVTSFTTKTEIEVPGPGELPPGKKLVPVKIEVPVQVAQSNGVTALDVLSGQYVEVDIQFAPTASTPDTSTATLLIQGDTWNPVSIPILAGVGQLSAVVRSISVVQGKSVTVEVTVALVAGAPTTAQLLIDADGSADTPNVTLSLSPSSLPLTKGSPASAKLSVTADSTLAAGQYLWSLAVWSYDYTASFSVPVLIIVTAPVVLGTLTVSATPKDIFIGESNTLTINATDTKTGRAVEGLKVFVAPILSDLTQERPHTDGVTGMGSTVSWKPC